MTRPAYVVETRWDGCEDAPSRQRLAEIVAELDVEDGEHPDAWLVHAASEWTLRLDEEGCADVSDQDGRIVCHQLQVSRAAGLDLWIRFAEAGFAGVEAERWRLGPRRRTPEEIEARRAESARLVLASDRRFFDLLGAEDASRPCRSAGCRRGSVQYSVLCRAHHFEQIRGRPCPFE